ncbi:hypothetical protein [Albibacillus kandeliae]|uniref:hypothetical protein n=1 Tax=Albibacillus kandeliae TaxID=2174228 RepID=UPI000D69056E|nr:hypothetical protein [Albibacillus kandeliae]
MRYDVKGSVLCMMGILATGAEAGCPQGQETFTSCQIAGHDTEVFVCFDNQTVTYSYGPIGGPADLTLSEPIERVNFEPWSGLGTAISESVTFFNQDYGYSVGGGFERPFSEEEMQRTQTRFGWVEVTENGERVASLECIPETVTYGFGGGLHDAKLAAGQTWDWVSKTWISDAVSSASMPILVTTRQYGVEFDCLPTSEFSLNGIRMSASLDALSTLGTPMATDETSFSDEPIDRLALTGASIDFSRGDLITMSATSPTWQMPSGLRVGLTRGEVVRILGRVPAGYTAISQDFTIPSCPEMPDANSADGYGKWFALIEFGQDKRVSKIALVTSAQ